MALHMLKSLCQVLTSSVTANRHPRLADGAFKWVKIKMADSPKAKRRKASSDHVKELDVFEELFPVLVEDLTKNGRKDDEISSATEWFKEVLEYNVPFGKKNRGLAVVDSYRLLAGNDTTEENLKIARVLGWCIELGTVGMEAINDSFYLENAVYTLLKKYCKEKPYYVDLMDLFHETTMQTIIGQCLDMRAAPGDGTIDFTHYTLPKYKAIVKWKTAFYSFYLPVASAMYLSGIADEESHFNAKTILLKMGEYFQIQDDFLDCYGDPAVTGKIGTDIEDNKCSWIMVQALQRASPEQRIILQNNYAQKDADKVARVKKVFADLNLKQVFLDYEERSYTELQELINKKSGQLPKEMFVKFAQKIYKRKK